MEKKDKGDRKHRKGKRKDDSNDEGNDDQAERCTSKYQGSAKPVDKHDRTEDDTKDTAKRGEAIVDNESVKRAPPSAEPAEEQPPRKKMLLDKDRKIAAKSSTTGTMEMAGKKRPRQHALPRPVLPSQEEAARRSMDSAESGMLRPRPRLSAAGAGSGVASAGGGRAAATLAAAASAKAANDSPTESGTSHSSSATKLPNDSTESGGTSNSDDAKPAQDSTESGTSRSSDKKPSDESNESETSRSSNAKPNSTTESGTSRSSGTNQQNDSNGESETSKDSSDANVASHEETDQERQNTNSTMKTLADLTMEQTHRSITNLRLAHDNLTLWRIIDRLRNSQDREQLLRSVAARLNAGPQRQQLQQQQPQQQQEQPQPQPQQIEQQQQPQQQQASPSQPENATVPNQGVLVFLENVLQRFSTQQRELVGIQNVPNKDLLRVINNEVQKLTNEQRGHLADASVQSISNTQLRHIVDEVVKNFPTKRRPQKEQEDETANTHTSSQQEAVDNFNQSLSNQQAYPPNNDAAISVSQLPFVLSSALTSLASDKNVSRVSNFDGHIPLTQDLCVALIQVGAEAAAAAMMRLAPASASDGDQPDSSDDMMTATVERNDGEEVLHAEESDRLMKDDGNADEGGQEESKVPTQPKKS